jgi:hypothetical protein
MREMFSGVKMLFGYELTDSFVSGLHDIADRLWFFRAPSQIETVNVIVEKRDEINLPFIKSQQFNGLRFLISRDRCRLIAPKKGVDNSQASL